MRDATSLKRFAAYVAVGAAGTAVQYVVLFAGTSTGWATPATASAVGAALGAVVNYWLNHRVTFSEAHNRTRDHIASIPKFAVTALAGVALTWLAMHAMTQRLHVPVPVAQLIATALTLAMTYTVNSAWTFRQRTDPRRPTPVSADTTTR